MLTLSVTRPRINAVLTDAADRVEETGWDPHRRPLMLAIDEAAGYTPGSGTVDAEDTSLAAWDALAVHLDDEWPSSWELQPGRTQAEVVAALRGAAKAVTAP
jgi:hypothetical protein